MLGSKKKKKMWCMYRIVYYLAIKMNEILSFATTWMELEGIMLIERSQAQKGKYPMFSLAIENRRAGHGGSSL